jgi:hypothetical protein
MLELLPYADGSLSLQGWLDPVGAAPLLAALDPLARRSGAEDHRLRARRYGDALVELAHHCLDAGTLPASAGVRPHILVSATLATLQGLATAPGGEVGSGVVVPQATVQRLACDATIRRVLLDPAGAVLDVGRARRVATPAQLAALRVRDGGCVWPGCTRRDTYTTAHHAQHWARGGATSLANMILLCHRHHWQVHEGGWQLTRD